MKRKKMKWHQLYHRRIKLGVKVENVAVLLGVSTSTMYRWERMISTPSRYDEAAWHDILTSIEQSGTSAS